MVVNSFVYNAGKILYLMDESEKLKHIYIYIILLSASEERGCEI